MLRNLLKNRVDATLVVYVIKKAGKRDRDKTHSYVQNQIAQYL